MGRNLCMEDITFLVASRLKHGTARKSAERACGDVRFIISTQHYTTRTTTTTTTTTMMLSSYTDISPSSASGVENGLFYSISPICF